MQTVYMVKHSENDISSKRGVDWFIDNRWMVTEGFIDGVTYQEPSAYTEAMQMLRYYDVIDFVELCAISDLKAIHPKLIDYPPEQPGYEPKTDDD